MKDKVLITGASGFVGGRILEHLAEKGDLDISVLLRDPAGLKGVKGFEIRVCEGDITKPASLKDAFAGQNVVIHCAALMSNFEREPRDKFYEVNVVGTENALKACDTGSLKQFIHISTAGVYGTCANAPKREDAPYGGILSAYEWSKKESEIAVLKYAKKKDLPFTILRPSQLYGRGMRYGWPEVIKAVKKGSIRIPGKGAARIHLLNIEDLVRAVRLVLLNEKAANRIYNIAGSEVASIGEVFDLISEMVAGGRIKRVPYLPVYAASLFLALIPSRVKGARLALLTPHRVRFFLKDRIYDISRARAELEFNPGVCLKEGFEEMVRRDEREDLI